MTLAELAQFVNTTVGNLVDVAFSGRAPATTSKPSKAPPSKTSSKPAKATATEAPTSKPGKVARGGLQLDQVLAALASVRPGPAKLEDVRARTGGTVPQVRSALQKLAGSKVTITGQRRDTRYAVR